MKAKKRKTMTDVLREAVIADGRSIYQLTRDADIPYPVLYRFIKGYKDGHKQSMTIITADKLAKVLGLRLRPTRKGR